MKTALIALAAGAALAGCATDGTYVGYGAPAYGVYSAPGVYYGNQPSYGWGSAPVYVYPNSGARGTRDRDADGIPNRLDNDRDNDGVPNQFDSRPNNPRRQ